MKRILFSLTAVAAGIGLGLVPEVTHAQFMTNAVRMMTGGQLVENFAGGTGPLALRNLTMYIVTRVATLVSIAAVYIIVRSGLRLINSQEEDKLNKARQTIAASVVAIILGYLTPRIVDAIYGGITVGNPGATGGTILEGGVGIGAGILASEIYGVIRWVTVLVAPISIVVIVFSALRAIVTLGSEEATGQLRRSVLGVASGILLLVMTEAIKATFGLVDGFPPGNPTTVPLILRVMQIIQSILLFMALGATAMIIYGGILMILNLGNEEQYGKGKKLIGRVLLGLVIIFFSILIVRFGIGLVLPVAP